MEIYRRSSWLLLLLVESHLFFIALHGVNGELDVQEGPSESECRPYIEKALKKLETADTAVSSEGDSDSTEDIPTVEITTDDSDQPIGYRENENDNNIIYSKESEEIIKEETQDKSTENDDNNSKEDDIENDTDDDVSEEQITSDEVGGLEVFSDNVLASEQTLESVANVGKDELASETQNSDTNYSEKEENSPVDEVVIIKEANVELKQTEQEGNNFEDDNDSNIVTVDDSNSKEDNIALTTEFDPSEETQIVKDSSTEDQIESEEDKSDSKEQSHVDIIINESKQSFSSDESKESKQTEESNTDKESTIKDKENESNRTEIHEEEVTTADNNGSEESKESLPVEELVEESDETLLDLRPRDHIAQLLDIEEDSDPTTKLTERMSEIILRDLKKLYDNAIKPLEILYKYKDLSNRHYGDSEIFAKPLILFMGPWSGGKSSIINYLLGIEFTEHALHTGAEPSPAYFNILMYGDEAEVLDGTQLAADYTFSGLQKFGQGLEERLRGYKLPNKLLEKMNIVEIPGILEVRKQVSRVFPFNDACQWFIDRADIIFLVYDPSKLDVGPETEAILDQLKGREHQTRIVLNKADQVKPEELMRVQGALIWNISPLMSSAQPPIMYTTSLWSKPYEDWAPVRLLQAQERAFLRDIRSAVDKRIDNKISSARRFAVRVRNHAKMVDCYLTTYYNHKSVFGNRKQVSDEIINHPQEFHIYEGLSTLTNISRYDLPDPDVYRDFFRLNALYEFQQLSATCTYFRGCPINRLDIAIAYDLPELVGKHKKLIETAANEANKPPAPLKS